MSDLPFDVRDVQLVARLDAAVDPEGKIERALEELGPMSGQRVVLLDSDRGVRTARLEALGARVTAVPSMSVQGLPKGTADALVSFWRPFPGGSDRTLEEIRRASRVLRPGGRMLIAHHYGRDDVSALATREEREREEAIGSQRDGWFLLHDHRIRVLHCWWTFDSLDDARSLLREAFGERAEAVLADIRRPRLSFKVAVYHRTFPEAVRAS